VASIRIWQSGFQDENRPLTIFVLFQHPPLTAIATTAATTTTSQYSVTMKYLENEKLTELTADLSDAAIGQSHRVINGRIEAYSMKRAGNDKKYALALGQKYVAEMEEIDQELAQTLERRRKRSSSAATFSEAVNSKKKQKHRRSMSFDYTLDGSSSKTTLGDFSELATRRLMTDLILTLNASFPDYDFSNAKPSQFEKLPIQTVRDRIYERLSELAAFKSQEDWLVELWTAVNDSIDLRECEIYSFEEDLEDNSLWSFHYFFVNKSLRRVVFFTCSEKIDEERQLEMVEEAVEEKVAFYPSDAQTVDDSDWDPSDNVSGGMSLPISTV
jgi:hypothetical protein